MASITEMNILKFVNSASTASPYDATIVIGEKCESNFYPDFVQPSIAAIQQLRECDSSDGVQTSVQSESSELPKLVVWSPTGRLNRDYDDVRRYKDAAIAGVKRALKAGVKKPLLAVYSSAEQLMSQDYKDALLVTVLGVFEAVYVPIEVRESVPDKSAKITMLGVCSNELKSEEEAAALISKACGLEHGRIVTRDIGGSDPERMAPGKVEEYVRSVFNGTSIKMSVVAGHQNFVNDYPLFAAVDRCADTVHRHQGRIIYLEYTGEAVEKTYMFVGKGVTYDTGGADVKAGGHMAGMHRDKCGAATVAGLFAMLEKLKPKGVKVVGRLAMVRNSVGTDAYVADEIITSAAGVRVRVGNTDAEGRMAMTDPLHHTRLQALNEVNPHLFTLATLTGHACLAVGEEYTIVLDNGPARVERTAHRLQEIGHPLSDPFEVSTLRREDYNFVEGRNEYEDLIQCNNLPSSQTPRGHQFPAAFMVMASGLSKHGIDSEQPLKYSHIDIAGSSGPYPGIPTAAPLLALGKLMKAF